MIFNVFLYGQSPNPQYGGSGGMVTMYIDICHAYIYIYLWPSVWWSPLPPRDDDCPYMYMKIIIYMYIFRYMCSVQCIYIYIYIHNIYVYIIYIHYIYT